MTFKRVEPCPLCVAKREYKFRKDVIEFYLAVMESIGCGELHIKEVEKTLLEDLEKSLAVLFV